MFDMMNQEETPTKQDHRWQGHVPPNASSGTRLNDKAPGSKKRSLEDVMR